MLTKEDLIGLGYVIYPLEEDPDWETVADYFGLDHSFCWTDEHIKDYTKRYLDSMAQAKQDTEKTAKALDFIKRIAALKKWGEPDDEREPFEPTDGHEDSHTCLMDLIDDARALRITPHRSTRQNLPTP